MQVGKVIGTACSTFAITNIDDMVVLVTFFAEASTSKTITPFRIILGQYLGFTVIITISMIGFGVSLVLPHEPIGFLGLLPILWGVWKANDLIPRSIIVNQEQRNEEESVAEVQDETEGLGEEADKTMTTGWKVILTVSAVTVVSGADNIGTYIPLFSQVRGAEIAIFVTIFYILLGVWCMVAFLILRQNHIVRLVQKYVRWALPFLYIGIGIYIIHNAKCYPWSIDRINHNVAGEPGKVVMGVSTMFLLLGCMGVMAWFQLRKKPAQATTDGGFSLEHRNLSHTEIGVENESVTV